MGASASTSTVRSSGSSTSRRPRTWWLPSPTHSSRPANQPLPLPPQHLDYPRTRFGRDPRAPVPRKLQIHHGGSNQMSANRLQIYTSTSCGDCTMAKAVLDRAGVDYEEIDIDRDPDAVATVLAINGGYTTVPTILLPTGQVLVEPSRQQLIEALGLEHLRPSDVPAAKVPDSR